MGKKEKRSDTNVTSALPDVSHAHPNDRPLLRKSSSATLLDTKGDRAESGEANGKTNGAFPKLRRRSSSLQDLTSSNDHKSMKRGKTEGKRGGKKKKGSVQPPKDGWAATGASTTSLPSVPGNSTVTRSKTANAQVAATASNATEQTQSKSMQRGRTRKRKPGDIILSRAATIEVVVKYELGQHELKKFKMCFNQIDLDSSGMIDYDEFFEFIDETKTPFSEGLFRMIDADSNGTIDYEEFVHAMVLYCMYTRDEILHFAFDTFDPSKTGSIGEKEFRKLVSLVNDGQPVFSGNIKNALAEFDRNKDGVIDFEEFKVMNKRFPMLLFPCFRLQDRMQKSTLGDSHWLQLHKRLYQRLKLENYQRKHNGALPSLGVVGSLRKFFHLDARDIYQP